ncbi:MAG TPA: GntR family transcriptional regulator [Pseudomonadales bacterium]|nr:GntR family transcriptional regulator [Pseudomonadales bacterium]
MAKAVDRAYQHIRDSILRGRFAPAQRLTEQMLVKDCGVSRTPVREALHRLAAENYVTMARNQGAQVKDWNRHDVEDLYMLRATLEGLAASRAAERIAAPDLAELERLIDAMDEALARRDSVDAKIGTFLELNGQMHRLIWRAAASERLEEMLRHLVDQALVARTATNFTLERLVLSQQHHRELLRALSAGDAMWAEGLMRSHIRAAQDDLVDQIGPRPLPALASAS